MPEEQNKPPQEVKVTDRRSFDSTGERRVSDLPRTEPPARRPAQSGRAPGAGSDPGDAGGIDFSSFSQYLGQVALHQMSGARDPVTGEASVNLEEARQTIEILQMLKKKTAGNLTPQEADSLDRLLSHLKLEYARRAAAARR